MAFAAANEEMLATESAPSGTMAPIERSEMSAELNSHPETVSSPAAKFALAEPPSTVTNSPYPVTHTPEISP